MCKSCGVTKCTCLKIITKTGTDGKKGRPGRDGRDAFITVKDGSTGNVANVTEVRFTDTNAVVTSPGAGIAVVNFVPTATVWNDVQNLSWYTSNGATAVFRPQYTINGNKITFRGLLYIPLNGVQIIANNSYLNQASAAIDETKLSVITNANTNNGSPQGRFMTTDIVTLKNLPAGAIPVGRDIAFDDVPAYRRYTDGVRVTIYRSFISIKIGSTMTVFKNGVTNIGSGCIMAFSPFNAQYDGSGTPPLGNDPLALLISNVTSGHTASNYVAATDDDPFTIPSAAATNPFDCNAHKIQSLGGFIINLEGLSGYLN